MVRTYVQTVHNHAENDNATASGPARPASAHQPYDVPHLFKVPSKRPSTTHSVDTDLDTKKDETAWTGRNGRHRPDTQTLISVTGAARRQHPGRSRST
jgi:hypothetical protein